MGLGSKRYRRSDSAASLFRFVWYIVFRLPYRPFIRGIAAHSTKTMHGVRHGIAASYYGGGHVL